MKEWIQLNKMQIDLNLIKLDTLIQLNFDKTFGCCNLWKKNAAILWAEECKIPYFSQASVVSSIKR